MQISADRKACHSRSHALRGNAARTLCVPEILILCVPAFQTFPDAERPDCIPTQSVERGFAVKVSIC
ncbi:MAG: hypothetical protein GY749_12080 [Desulfobacteraceae bacterium]|nr:hypothetical protein [Desulfobacteraceae bacterium]